MLIRPARVEDPYGIAKVHIDSWKTAYSDILSSDYLSKIDYGKKINLWTKILAENHSKTFVAVDNNTIVGFAHGGIDTEQKGFDGELYAMYILKDYQSRGVGKKLFSRVVEYLIENSIDSMVVWIIKDNPAIHFYQRLGGILINEKDHVIAGRSFPKQCYGWPNLKAYYSNWIK